MKKRLLYFCTVVLFSTATGTSCIAAATAGSGDSSFKWNHLPVKALLLNCPNPKDVPLLCGFIKDALPKEGVNTLCLRIEYQYKFQTHPELADVNALSKQELQSIVAACRSVHIRFIPTMNLLAHQSDKDVIGPLLKQYPQFDESPDYNPPVPWKDGGPFDFYTKSLCPLHPDLFKILFPIMDELIDVCGADAMHVGLDEVWVLGYDKCPRCGGRDKAELFAGYVTKLHDHLRQKHCEMWMWSDRLIDGKTTNLLGWQASMNDTYKAIDMIPKDIMICDWKYEDAPPTPAYFAIKGFNVLASACSKPDVALAQLDEIRLARKNGTRQDFSVTLASRMKGVFETMWFNTGDFIRCYYHGSDNRMVSDNVETFKALFAAVRKDEAEDAPIALGGSGKRSLAGTASYPGVKELAMRRVPWLAPHLVFSNLEKEDSNDVFELSTKNGTVDIAASGANAAAVGLNWYLKYYCHRSMSHMGDNLSPVYPLPVLETPLKIDASAQIRYALNYCTYNYTMSFYTWKDWAHELDWMALNGVNTLLVANGEEAVWQNVLIRMGYGHSAIDSFITGPAYNAWWLMGNIQGWGGPMPQTQIDDRKVLVQKMLARMGELGIEPVMPAFFGMVPGTLKDKLKAHIIKQGTWGFFTRPDILDPTDTAFDRIAGLFYEETRNLYGKDIHYFSGDPFHEGGITDGIDLGEAGLHIQNAMHRYFPGSVWVLQGWQQNPRAEMLAKVDKSDVLVQELFGETTNNWEKRKAYEGTPFIWCMITNYGERPGLYGKLQRYADEPYRAGHGEYASFLKGVGIMPEGINNNPVAYDLMLEVGWRQEHIDVSEWIKNYALYRYGKYNEDIAAAWQLFLQTIYSSPEGYQEGPPENILCARPALQIKSVSTWGTLRKNYDIALYQKAVRLFAKAAPDFKGSDTYAIDLVNFKRQVLANKADSVFAGVATAYRKKDTVAFGWYTSHFLALSDSMEHLLNTHPYYRLSTYQKQALASGRTPEEKQNNLHNAMMLITYWGGNDPREDNLHEYAYKEWAGMMQSFYKKRWALYFDYLRKRLKGEPAVEPDWFRWERDWEKGDEKINRLR
jgi:alpha-N-acetylglucosaminidase